MSDTTAKRRQHAHPPVAELVPGSFNHNRSVIRNLTGGHFLIGEELQQVLSGTGIEIVFINEARERGRLWQGT